MMIRQITSSNTLIIYNKPPATVCYLLDFPIFSLILSSAGHVDAVHGVHNARMELARARRHLREVESKGVKGAKLEEARAEVARAEENLRLAEEEEEEARKAGHSEEHHAQMAQVKSDNTTTHTARRSSASETLDERYGRVSREQSASCAKPKPGLPMLTENETLIMLISFVGISSLRARAIPPLLRLIRTLIFHPSIAFTRAARSSTPPRKSYEQQEPSIRLTEGASSRLSIASRKRAVIWERRRRKNESYGKGRTPVIVFTPLVLRVNMQSYSSNAGNESSRPPLPPRKPLLKSGSTTLSTTSPEQKGARNMLSTSMRSIVELTALSSLKTLLKKRVGILTQPKQNMAASFASGIHTQMPKQHFYDTQSALMGMSKPYKPTSELFTVSITSAASASRTAIELLQHSRRRPTVSPETLSFVPARSRQGDDMQLFCESIKTTLPFILAQQVRLRVTFIAAPAPTLTLIRILPPIRNNLLLDTVPPTPRVGPVTSTSRAPPRHNMTLVILRISTRSGIVGRKKHFIITTKSSLLPGRRRKRSIASVSNPLFLPFQAGLTSSTTCQTMPPLPGSTTRTGSVCTAHKLSITQQFSVGGHVQATKAPRKKSLDERRRSSICIERLARCTVI
ncbi:hypothetical protein JCM8097_009367 [Rhodosporidiobolus ruineniae]